MRSCVLALIVGLLGACGGGDTGILVEVTRDDSVTGPVDSLHFVIGVYDPASDAYVRDDFGAETYVDVSDRDLVADPYRLLLRDAGPGPEPTSIVVAVIGETGGLPVAFAGMGGPMTFRDGSVLELGLTLSADTPFTSTATGCLSWAGVTVVSPTDLDCNGCDDATNTCQTDCTDGEVRSCYSGDPATAGVGVCRAGTQTCWNDQWTPCSGEVIPGGEGCNLEDDDCDGQVDEDLGTITCGLGACAATTPACFAGAPGICTPSVGAADDTLCDGFDNDCDGAVDEDCNCALVAPGGDDAAAVADDNATPFATVQAAIDWAAGDAGRPQLVCLATSCGGSPAVYTGPVTMRSGISVAGGYDLARARCATPSTIAPGTATGVLFDDEVQLPTNLDRVIVQRFAAGAAGTTAGVTIDGAAAVTLFNVEIVNAPAVATSYGVNLINGGQALITRSRIHGGNGSTLTVGVRSVGSAPLIRDNCSGYDGAGRCNAWCDEQWIQGRSADGTGRVHAVLLEDSPGAVVDRNSLCSINGDGGAVVQVTGKGAGVAVRRNLIDAWGPTVESSGVRLADCGGDAPWITDNASIGAAGDLATTSVTAVRSLGDCHPVIERNLAIRGGNEGGTVGTTGVFCGASGVTGVASRCVVIDNPLIQSSQVGFPPESIGVRCEDGGCMRVARNRIDAHGGVNTVGLWLGRTGALIDSNDISGGCGTATSFGVHAVTSSARLENNRIFAGSCENLTNAGLFIGLSALVEDGLSELDVHSNHIDGQGATASCQSAGVRLSPGSGLLVAGSGRFRNNIIRAGLCPTSYGIEETQAATDPRELWNNDLVPLDSPTALYRDEALTDLTDIAQVNALTDASVQANISADPMQVSYPTDLHLTSGSACDGAGTPAGAPPTDMDGDLRSTTAPDIGPDER